MVYELSKQFISNQVLRKTIDFLEPNSVVCSYSYINEISAKFYR